MQLVKEQRELSDGFLHGHWSWNTKKTFNNGCKQNTVLSKWTAVAPGWGAKHVCIQQQFATWPALNHKPSHWGRAWAQPAAVQDRSLLLISRGTNGLCFTPHANLSAVSTFTDVTRLVYFHALIINHLQGVAANKSWSASQVRFAAAVSQLIAGNTRYFSNEFPCPRRHRGCEIKKKNYHTLLFL